MLLALPGVENLSKNVKNKELKKKKDINSRLLYSGGKLAINNEFGFAEQA